MSNYLKFCVLKAILLTLESFFLTAHKCCIYPLIVIKTHHTQLLYEWEVLYRYLKYNIIFLTSCQKAKEADCLSDFRNTLYCHPDFFLKEIRDTEGHLSVKRICSVSQVLRNLRQLLLPTSVTFIFFIFKWSHYKWSHLCVWKLFVCLQSISISILITFSLWLPLKRTAAN